MAYELLTGRNNLNTLTLTMERTLFLVSQILTHTAAMLQAFSPEAADLITRLLEREPTKRLGGGERDAQDIKTYPFFRSV
jgi:hypothetical protein